MSASEMTHMLKIAGGGSMAAGIAAGYSAGIIAGFWVGIATGLGLAALCVGGYLIFQYLTNHRKLAWILA